jgi:DNA-binding IclR family transcriptional regulator
MTAPDPSIAIKAKPSSGAETGRKLLHVLMCFSGSRPSWSVADIAAELGLTMSTAYRYVGLLKEEGFLEVSADSLYSVAERAMSLADAYAANRSGVIDIALPVMAQVRDEIGETVLLARRVGEFAFCIERVESLEAVRLQFDRGQAMSLHSGSMSRLLLSHMPDRERARYLEKARPVVSEDRLPLLEDSALASVFAAGHAESFEEIDPLIWGCAAAIERPGEETLVIGTAGPVYRLDASARSQAKKAVIAAAAKITEALRTARR